MHLLPEETLYLLERGNLDLRFLEDGDGDDDDDKSLDGLPFSLQQAYTFLIGRLGLTLERYTVYAGLKRSGYIVQRGPAWYPEDVDKDVVPLREAPSQRTWSLLAWLQNFVHGPEESSPQPIGPLVKVGLYRSYGPLQKQ